MVRVRVAVGRLVREDRGQDLLEYGLLVVLIALAAIVAVGTLGNVVSTRLWAPIVQSI
jgi:Flp pilus assembly pilin Flp